MAKRTLFTWVLLLMLTLIAGLISGNTIGYVAIIILTLSALKFIGVAFEFMDLKTAHSFWKIALTTFLMVFIVVVLILFEYY